MLHNILYIILSLLILNIFISVFLYTNNKKLRLEIEELKTWCEEKINQIIIDEGDIDKKLAQAIKEISDNKVSKDVIEIMNYEGKCPYHEQVFKDMVEYQTDMINKVQEIRNQKDKIITDIIKSKKENLQD